MKIKRFDVTEFEVINHAKPDGEGGYYPNDPYKSRALLLMKEGILEHNPVNNWSQNGWTLTEMGIEYRKEFTDKVRKRHGHRWKTYGDTNPDCIDKNYINKINI